MYEDSGLEFVFAHQTSVLGNSSIIREPHFRSVPFGVHVCIRYRLTTMQTLRVLLLQSYYIFEILHYLTKANFQTKQHTLRIAITSCKRSWTAVEQAPGRCCSTLVVVYSLCTS